MSLLSKLLPSKSTLTNPLKNIPVTKSQITNAVKNPASVVTQGLNTIRDVGTSELDRGRALAQGGVNSAMTGIDASRGLARNAVDVARNGLKSAKQMGKFDIKGGLSTAANGIPMAAQGMQTFANRAVDQGKQALGVKIGNALTAPAQQPVINQPIPQPQAQKTFAPQMQMPYNQPIQRAYSGMQFGNTPNPAQPPQMPPQQRPIQPQMPPQMMPQAQPQNIQNQFAQQFGAPPPKNGMGPQKYPNQLMPDLDKLVKGIGITYM